MNGNVIMISAAIFVACIAFATIVYIKHKQYIGSIKIGDKFMRYEPFDEDVNPFEEKREPRIVEITDIRTNKNGKKYVQYRYIYDQPDLVYSAKLDIFNKLFLKTF